MHILFRTLNTCFMHFYVVYVVYLYQCTTFKALNCYFKTFVNYVGVATV